MDRHGERTPQSVLKINISPTKMTKNAEKRYKIAKVNEIISAVCALFNSGGGKIMLCFDSLTPKQHVHACIRTIEQRLVEMVEITIMTSHIKFEINSQEIILYILETNKLVSVNYHLHLPNESQVVAVPATDSVEEIKKMIRRKIVEEKSVQIGSHSKIFVTGQHSGLHESTEVQLKSLKASSSKCVTLADRITGKSNKLTSYISAFANHCGGHIYYGINDEGIVDGEEIKETEKDEIVKKVSKTINKMIWPRNRQPRRDKQWDIFFELVKDSSGNPLSSTFVIVISVLPCLGGVFTEVPESYYIADGKVKKFLFSDWWRNFTAVSERAELPLVPCHMSRVSWSSEKNRNICRTLRERLVQHRNDEDTEAFNALSQLATEKFPESGADLIVKAEQVVIAYKHCHFHKAESLLQQFATLLRNSKDSSIFEVRMLLLRSMIEHSKGKCEDSYVTAQQGLQMVEQVPVDLTTISFHIEVLKVITTILTTTTDCQRYSSLKDAGRQFLQLAVRDAKALEQLPCRMSDLRQKLHIYKAWFFLDCSITGQVAQQKHGICTEDIEAAARELASVSESILKETPLTQFRKIQYHQAQCDLFRRRSEIQQEDYIRRLRAAFECASNARALARRHRFENMVDYANKRLADLTEKLVRYAFKTCGGQRNKNFFGFKY